MAKIQYLDFDLRIERSDAGYRARVLRCPAGQGSAEGHGKRVVLARGRDVSGQYGEHLSENAVRHAAEGDHGAMPGGPDHDEQKKPGEREDCVAHLAKQPSVTPESNGAPPGVEDNESYDETLEAAHAEHRSSVPQGKERC